VYEYYRVLVVDGREQPWPSVGIGDEVFWSADNRTIATTVQSAANQPAVVVVAGRTWPAFDQTTPIGFSPDGRNFAAVARHNEQQFIVIDGQKRAGYEEIGVGKTRASFTPEGKLTYLARKGDNSIVWVEEFPAGLAPEPVVAVKPAGQWEPLFNGK